MIIICNQRTLAQNLYIYIYIYIPPNFVRGLVSSFSSYPVILHNHHNVVYDRVTLFNYDDKKARDVSLTCWCHLSNTMPDNIFHESMRQGTTCSVWFCLFVWFFDFCLLSTFFVGWYFCFPQRWTQYYHYNISGHAEILSYNGLRQMELISLQ